MSAARVRRGAPNRGRPKKAAPRVSVPKKLAARLPVEQAEANRLATWAFGLFVLAIAAVALIALDVPAKVGLAAGEAVGDAGFRVKSVDIQGLKRMDPKPVYAIALDQKTTAMPLVDVSAIRQRLLDYGWIKDARVSRRFPDTLVIDVVERKPAALWQDDQRLSLIDAEGVVLDRVPVSQMPDLPLLIGKGANGQAVRLERLLDQVPALKAQLASASWVGQRRWDLSFQSGETIALPEGAATAAAALTKFAKVDKSSGLLGRGMLRFDLRIPGKMIVRLPREPGEPIIPEAPSES
ncbi:MAG: FtsQ-type POTRA domain-containing protein [Sphingomonas sp.]|uniref:cell division protein FtsQ/DivIB n=1 Tax=Sphingomonas sp. TaxID=28214 RepID=UPI00185120B2|nr:cell division protein FtsQ/DivIB [Sphingomonas sp.]MBA3666583.1 FtsQ-type POTRA domain-containing protein [Sphingomonas sp.]